MYIYVLISIWLIFGITLGSIRWGDGRGIGARILLEVGRVRVAEALADAVAGVSVCGGEDALRGQFGARALLGWMVSARSLYSCGFFATHIHTYIHTYIHT